MWPLYLGGFLGPFGGAMVNAMLPELASGLGTSVPTAATAVTWYMIPFSALMLVSGTIGARHGITRAIRLAFVAYAAASLVCVVATSPLSFLGGRMLQGAANAFTTPLLLALIAEIVPMQRLGRALGTFAAWGAAGQAFAPFVGGAAAGVDYRWAFGLSAVVALGLAALVSSRPLKAGASRSAQTRWRDLLNPSLGVAALTGFAGQFTATTVMLIGALMASDRFGLEPAARGLVVAGFGVAGFASGRGLGRLADRLGGVRTGVMTLLVLGVAALLMPMASWLLALVLAVGVAGAGATGTRVLTNGLSMRSTPSNPAGATSAALALSFVGSALTPLMLPLYHWRPEATGVIPLVLCAFAAAVTHAWRRHTPRI